MYFHAFLYPLVLFSVRGHESIIRSCGYEEKMVGGEKKGDQKLKERRKERKAYAKSKKEKLSGCVQRMI